MSKFLLELITNPMDKITFEGVQSDLESYFELFNMADILNLSSLNIFVNKTRIVVFFETEIIDKSVFEQFVPKMLRGIETRNQMRWSTGSIAFYRPIANIVAILDDELINVEIEGVKSTMSTLIDYTEPIEVSSVDDYFEKMKSVVSFDAEESKNKIRFQANRMASSLGKMLTNDTEKLYLITKFVENPVIAYAKFDEKYSELPSEILYSIINKYDLCVPLQENDGELSNYYLIAIEKGKNESAIKEMYENTINSDLSMLGSSIINDKTVALKEYIPRLNWFSVNEAMGNLYDKTSRIKLFVNRIAEDLFLAKEMNDNLLLASGILKADLATSTVKRYPQLKGIVGKILLDSEGYDKSIGEAVMDQYLPTNDNKMPRNSIGYILAIADRFDDIMGYLITENNDYHLLKNLSNEIINLIINSKLDFNINSLIQAGLYVYTEESIGAFDYKKIESKMKELYQQSIKNSWRSLGINEYILNNFSFDFNENLSSLTYNLIYFSGKVKNEDESFLKTLVDLENILKNQKVFTEENREIEAEIIPILQELSDKNLDEVEYFIELKAYKNKFEELLQVYKNETQFSNYANKIYGFIKSRWF